MARKVRYCNRYGVKVFGSDNFKGKNEGALDGLLEHTLKMLIMIAGRNLNHKSESKIMVWGIEWHGLHR